MKNSVISCWKKNKILHLYIAGFLFLLVSAATGLCAGSTLLSPAELADALRSGFNASPGARILGYVRLPRVLASLICGAALAVSGAVIQGVLANRLASPGIIGVNAGAGLAVTLGTALGMIGGWQVSLFAFAGAFGSVMLVSLGARRWGASRSTVILMGVAMNSLLGAFSDTITTLMPEAALMRSEFRIGDFSSVTYPRLVPAAILVGIGILLLCTLHNELDVLAMGDENARALGLNTARMRTLFLLLAALLAGCAVSLAGLLSFVGLLVPHGVRRIAGGKASRLMGLCALFGAGFVCLCDTIARSAFAPYELPVGMIMAYLGAPFFVVLLIRGKGGHRHD